MSKKAFVTCLNDEVKIYNFPVMAVVVCAAGFAVVGLFKGLIWGMGAGALGFVLGSWLSKEWHAGDLQRKLYWQLPWQKAWIHKNMPESHHRNLM